jgi:hypothetical protein
MTDTKPHCNNVVSVTGSFLNWKQHILLVWNWWSGKSNIFSFVIFSLSYYLGLLVMVYGYINVAVSDSESPKFDMSLTIGPHDSVRRLSNFLQL